MSIYLSCHPLDYEFTDKLHAYIYMLGFDSQICNADFYDNLDQYISEGGALVSILRPEYLQSDDFAKIANYTEKFSAFFPVLRIPIAIEEWSANTVFQPIADFTNSDDYDDSLNLLSQALLSTRNMPDRETRTPTEIYLRKLKLRLNGYLRPLVSLETINYRNQSDHPVSALLSKAKFKTVPQIHGSGTNNAYQNRNDYLDNYIRYCKRLIVACGNLDSSAVLYHLVDKALQLVSSSFETPIPLLLDADQWPSDMLWRDWLCSHATASDNPVGDITSGKYSVYAYRLDSNWFKNHPLRHSFEDWLYGTTPPQHLVILCTNLSDLDDGFLAGPTIVPVENNLIDFNDVLGEFENRPFGNFLADATNTGSSSPALSCFLQYPMFVAALLSLKFGDKINFKELSVGDYFNTLIIALVQNEALRSHAALPKPDDLENNLSRLAALVTERQQMLFSYNDLQQVITSEYMIESCLNAGILSLTRDVVRFSMPTLQVFFAANALAKFGMSIRIPNLRLDNQLHRIPWRWDNAIVISSHTRSDNSDFVKSVAKYDPLLALRCVVCGSSVSAASYAFVIEQNLNSFATLGDFRLDFATLLYAIDKKTAKAILIEVLRNAYWPIRLNAYLIFSELENSYLSGLAEAIIDLTDTTRNQVRRALRRLGTEAISTLFALLKTDNAKVRANAIWGLTELRDKACVPALIESLKDNDLNVSKQVVASLESLNDIHCVPYLVQHTHTHNVSMRKVINTALTNLQSHMPNEFEQQIQKLDPAGKKSIMRLFHDYGSDTVIDLMLSLSHDENVDVQIDAIRKLADHPETRVISRLEECLDDMTKSRLSKTTVSDIVSKILPVIKKSYQGSSSARIEAPTDTTHGKALTSSDIVKARLLQVKTTRTKEQDAVKSDESITKSDHVVPIQNDYNKLTGDDTYVLSILEQLRERTWANSNNASRALREYIKGLHGTASLKVINQILETLNDSDWIIRWTGVETLGWTGNINVVPHLVQRLTDNNWKVRVAAIRSLAEIGDPTAVTGLSPLLSDTNSIVREATAEALGILNGLEALQALEGAVADQEDFVRLAAIESLGRLHQKDAAKILLSALKDKSEHVRWAAANGLSSIATADMVSSLIPSLSDTEGPYWEQKRICDVIVDILKQIGTDEAVSVVANWGRNHV